MTFPHDKNPDDLTQERDQLLGDKRRMDGRLFDYHSLLRSSRALHHCRQPGELTDVMRAMIRDKLGGANIWIYLFEREAKEFQLIGATEECKPASFVLDPGILWQLLVQGEPLSVVDMDGGFRFPELFATTGLDNLPAVVWVPMVMEDNPLGIIALGALPGDGEYTPRELEFLRTLASITLYQRLQSEQARLDRTIRDLSVLYDISRAVSQIDNMKQLLLEILERAIERVGAERGSIMLYVQDEDLLRLQVVRGLPDPIVEQRINSGEQECKTFRPGDGIAGTVFQTGEAYLSHDTSSDEKFAPSGETRVESIACLPLICNDQPIGVLNITNKRESHFCSEDVEILAAIAGQAALTIEKADLYQLAITDELTGLYVRRYFYRRLDDELRRSNRYETTVSMVLLDIDHFKKFNDTHGHAAGDEVLKEVSKCMLQQCREIDVVSRYGGEEFAVLLPETPQEGALTAAERLRSSVEAAEVQYEGKTLKVTISLGVCEVAGENNTREAIIGAADMALYHAKASGRNQVVAWEEGMEMPEE